MNRFRNLALLCLCLVALAGSPLLAKPASLWASLDMKNLFGKPLPAQTTEKPLILFVNVASRCGYTNQYSGLQKLYETYKDRGLQVVGVPCNQFGGQEPGSPEQIQKFCSSRYNVGFPILQKQDVNGAKRSKLYTHLIKQSGGRDIGWNFEKILVTADGEVVQRFPSSTRPMSSELTAAIEANLPKANKKAVTR